MLSFLGVFVALFVLDFVFAKYTRAVTASRTLAASLFASAIVFLNGAAAIGYVNDPWLLIPAVLGAFSGTWLAVKMDAV